MNEKEYASIGKRFVDACTKLNDLGVFYGKNYDGKYHEIYGHELHWFALHLDKHRGGFKSVILREGDVERCVDSQRGDNETPYLTIVDLLENTATILTNEFGETPDTVAILRCADWDGMGGTTFEYKCGRCKCYVKTDQNFCSKCGVKFNGIEND